MNSGDLQTIILCGGLGTRLKNLYPDLPKALVPVAGKPFIEWQVEWLANQGIKKIHLAAGYKADFLQRWIAEERAKKFLEQKLTFSREPEPLGTGGGLLYAMKHLGVAGGCLVLNGDTLFPAISLKEFIAFWERSGFEIVIAAAKVEDSSRFGTLIFDDNRLLLGFNEKSQGGVGWINAGIYLMNTSSFTRGSFKNAFSIEKDFFPEMVRDRKIGVFPASGKLLDMGTPDGIREMEAFLAGKI